MSGWSIDSPRDRWGDDEDDFPLSQRSPCLRHSSYDFGTSAAAASSLGYAYTTTAACYDSYPYVNFPGARCATPVHRPAARSPLSPRGRGTMSLLPVPEVCPACNGMSRTVGACCDDRCRAAACITCRFTLNWHSCDSCGELYCSRHEWPFTFETRECCGLHLLTEEAYYLCRVCAVDLANSLPPQDCNRQDDATHGVFACTHCSRDTCHHALHCHSCGMQNDVQRRMMTARREAAPLHLPHEYVDKLRGLDNTCLAKDILQYLHSFYEPEPPEPEPPVLVHMPLRRGGGRRTAKNARRPEAALP